MREKFDWKRDVFMIVNHMMFEFSDYFPHGPQTNVPLSTVTQGGWTECFTGVYNSTKLIASILSACSGSKLMLACRPTASTSTIQLLAWAPREDVLFQTTDKYPKHYAQGSSWYYSTNTYPISWGFAKEGDEINRSSCDWKTENGQYRLCWHTGSKSVSSGYRCGANMNAGSKDERIIFHR